MGQSVGIAGQLLVITSYFARVAVKLPWRARARRRLARLYRDTISRC